MGLLASASDELISVSDFVVVEEASVVAYCSAYDSVTIAATVEYCSEWATEPVDYAACSDGFSRSEEFV